MAARHDMDGSDVHVCWNPQRKVSPILVHVWSCASLSSVNCADSGPTARIVLAPWILVTLGKFGKETSRSSLSLADILLEVGDSAPAGITPVSYTHLTLPTTPYV